jgi:hypothetical protein
MTVIVPITNDPNQLFSCVVPNGSTNLNMGFYITWNGIANYWMMTIYLNAIELISNLPMVNINLLGQYQYLNIGQAYIVPLTKIAESYPGINDWSTNFILAWS